MRTRRFTTAGSVLFSGLAALLLWLYPASGLAQAANAREGVEVFDNFAGAWKLAWLERTGADGVTHRIQCCGMLVFTRDGHISVQVMERDSSEAAPATPEQYSQGGYEASYGTFTVDEHAHTFTFHVDGALVRSLMGKDLARKYEFSSRQLIVKPTGSDEHWAVCWERFQPAKH